MGCMYSTLRAEDVVGRCKVRKKLMKQAVEHRHAFAAAHASYVQALRSIGSALRQFAEGEGGLPAAGPGPFDRIPEPPPPPPLPQLPPPALSDTPSPLKNSQVPSATLTLDSHSRRDWDFFEPFDPSEPPLHLQEQRKRKVQKDGAEGSDVDEADIKQSTSVPDIIFQAEEKESIPILQVVASPYSRPVMDAVVGGTSNEYRDEHGRVSSPGSKSEDVMQSFAESRNEKHPTQRLTEEPLDEGNIEHDMGFRLRLNVRKKDFMRIARELDEEFLKASKGAEGVAVALEIRKPHSHTAQPKNKFGKYNSARVFSTFNWTWSRNPLLTKEELESNLDESGRNASHALTLERLLAWEKKLFEEVKAVESLTSEREKKCACLRRQEVKGEDASKIEKTRMEIKKLYSLIMVSYQRVDSTEEAIEDLRDDELHPQLVGLIDGLMNMWTTTHLCHARQTQIIIHIKSLDAMMSQEPTSEAHHQATAQLEKELLGWHESFCKLVAAQRQYMGALYGWLKLSLMPIPTSKDKKKICDEGGEEGEELDIYRICEEWQRALGCLPDKVASEAIKSLAEVVKAMVGKQGEEMKQKNKVEKLEKLWEKRDRALRPLEEEEEEERKMRRRRRRLRAGAADEDDDEEEGRVVGRLMPAIGLMERREAVAAMKKKLEGEMMKYGRAVQDTRVLTMNNLQTGLPGVLEAMTGFSSVCSQAFQHLHSVTRFSNPSN